MVMAVLMLLWNRAEPTGYSKCIRSGEAMMFCDGVCAPS
jgi:hypothetical protein